MGYEGIPGHEFVGLVEDAPDPVWIGTRVVGEINCPCRTCPTCRSGQPNHCPERTVLGIVGRQGAFAEHLTLPLENLHRLPDSVSDEEGVFVEPVAACFEILQQVAFVRQDKIVIVGDGRVGLLTAQVLVRTGANVMLIGHHEQHLALLRNRGVKTLLEKEVKSLAVSDVVIDCSGTPSGFHLSRGLVRPGGRLVLKSTFAAQVSVDLSSLVVDEITLIGSRCGPFAPALSALASGEIEVRSLIHAVYPLEQGEEAFKKAGQKGVLKVLLKMD
jgi:threonine dehydrogenase-like Zn-dependent dehydrogenase